ncbi:hypothetical protein J6590_075722, partial [Homalodisca vitripennis]
VNIPRRNDDGDNAPAGVAGETQETAEIYAYPTHGAVDLRNNHDSHHAETSLRFRCTTCQSLHRRWNGVASHYARCRGPPMTVPAAETYAFSCGRRFSTQVGLTLHRNTYQPDARNARVSHNSLLLPSNSIYAASAYSRTVDTSPTEATDASTGAPPTGTGSTTTGAARACTRTDCEATPPTWITTGCVTRASFEETAAGGPPQSSSPHRRPEGRGHVHLGLHQGSRGFPTTSHGEPEDPPGSPPDGPPGPPGSPRRREDPEAENEGRDALDWERILAHINAIQPLCPIGNQLRTPAARVGSIHEEDNPETAA